MLQQPDQHVRVRAELARRFWPLVLAVAAKVSCRLPVEVSELAGDGALGLLRAIERFDPTRGLKFGTYARHAVLGAMLDGVRSRDWVPRLERRRRGDACYRMQSLAWTPRDRDGEEIEAAERFADPASGLGVEWIDAVDAVRRWCVGLDRRERLIVELYYVANLNEREIGDAVGLSPSRVNQLHHEILARLKARTGQEQSDGEEEQER